MSTSSRDAVARGDVKALVESLGPDEIETVDLTDIPIAGIDGQGGWFARIGHTQFAVRNDGAVQVHVHDTEQDAVECFAGNVERFRRLKEGAAQGPLGLMAALMSVLGSMPEDEGEDTEPIPAQVSLPVIGRASVPGVREVSTTEPAPGLYL